MILSTLGIAFSITLGQIQGPSASPKNLLVKGVLLLTGDSAIAKKLRKEFHFMPGSQLVKMFPPSRFDIVEWNDDYRVVIDRTTGPLGGIYDRTILEQGFAKKSNSLGAMDVATMSGEEYAAARALFGGWPIDPKTNASMEPVALGLSTSYTVNLHSDGVARKIEVGIIDPRKNEMREAIRQKMASVLAGSPYLSKEQRGLTPPPRDEFDFLYLAIPPHDVGEGTRRAAEALTKIEARMRREAKDAADEALKSLGYHQQLEGATDMAQVPRSLRYGLEDNLKNGWKSLGFGSQSEALDFLGRCDSFEVETDLFLHQTIDPGDPSTGRASAAVDYQFQAIPGAYLP